jgi:hypothetical protein
MKKLKLILIGETADVTAEIQTLTGKVTALNTAVESLITLTKSVQAQLSTIGTQTTDPSTVAALQQVEALIDTETANVTAELATANPPAANKPA